MSTSGACPACGTWECLDCGWTRARARRDGESGEVMAGIQTCYRCGSTWGQWWAAVHREPRATDHREQWLREKQEAL